MARPRKHGVEYFPFDCDFYDDDKIDYVLATAGTGAVVGYQRILCSLYRVGLCWRFGEVEIVAFARKCSVEPKIVREWLCAWLDCNLFSEEVYAATGFLTSKGVQRRYVEIVKGRVAIQVPKGVLLLSDDELPSNLTISFIDLKVKVKVKGNLQFSTVSEIETTEKPQETHKTQITQEKTRVRGPTEWSDLCIPKDALVAIAQNPDYGGGDPKVVRDAWLDLRDWAVSKGARKKDWTATLRTWIRRNKQQGRYKPKTFSEIDQDNFDAACDQFFNNNTGD